MMLYNALMQTSVYTVLMRSNSKLH